MGHSEYAEGHAEWHAEVVEDAEDYDAAKNVHGLSVALDGDLYSATDDYYHVEFVMSAEDWRMMMLSMDDYHVDFVMSDEDR